MTGHHRDRFSDVTDADMPVVSHKILWYGFGVGGRIFDLPRQYQDAVAQAVVQAHPSSFYRRALLYCLVSGEFRRSTHPQVTGLTVDELRRRTSDRIQSARHRRGLQKFPDRYSQLAAARAAKAAKAERLRAAELVIGSD